MGSKSIASLFIDLKANTASFAKGMDKAVKKARTTGAKIEKAFSTIGPAFALAATAVVAGTAAMVRSAVLSADELSKMSQAVGISVESLSGLAFGAEQSGLDLKALGDRLTNLNRRAKEGARGVQSYRAAFDTLGVTLTNSDGSLRGTEDLLLDVADGFAKLKDGTLKSALATDIFSNAGVKMLPFLNQGRAGIEALKDEAADLGLVLSTETAQAAERFNDNLSKLGSAVQGVGFGITAALLPAMESLTERMVGFVKEGDKVKSIGDSIATAALKISLFFSGLSTTAQIAIIAIAGLEQAFIELLRAPFTKTFAGVTGVLEEAQLRMEEVAEKGSIALTQLGEAFVKLGNEGKPALDSTATALGGLSTKVNSTIAALKTQIETFGLSEPALLAYKLGVDGATESQIALALQLQAVGELQKATIVDHEVLIESLAGVNEAFTTLTKEGIEGLNLEFADGINTVAGYTERLKKLGVTLDRTATELEGAADAGEVLRAGFGDMFDDALSGGKQFIQIVKKMVQALIKLIVKLLIVKALNFFAPGLGKALGGFFAEGGRPPLGKVSIVGEGGPELFKPDITGTIIPLQDLVPAGGVESLGGGGMNVTNNFNIHGLLSSDSLAEIMEQMNGLVRASDVSLVSTFSLSPAVAR